MTSTFRHLAATLLNPYRSYVQTGSAGLKVLTGLLLFASGIGIPRAAWAQTAPDSSVSVAETSRERAVSHLPASADSSERSLNGSGETQLEVGLSHQRELRQRGLKQRGLAQAEDSTQEGTELSVRAAIRLALEENYSLRDVKLDVANADAQVREAWGALYPQINATGSYTRNIKTANPFAGSDVTGLFSGGGATEWVTFNEQARTDDNAQTEPITIGEFRERQRQGRREAGITPGGGGNPFGVDNEFIGAISVRQTLYNGQAFSAIDGAQTLKQLNKKAVDRQQQVTVNEVRQAYYDALLARRQVSVTQQSVERARETYQEITQQVSTGTVPKSERLGAEVEYKNQQSQLIQARADYQTAVDGLKRVIGINVDRPIQLSGTLDTDDQSEYYQVSVTDAVQEAISNRPDLKQARLSAELQEVRKDTEQSSYLPTVAAVGNFSMSGRVPDNRTVTLSDPNDPFAFDTNTRDFFADSYWNPSASVGIELSWTIFSGFQRQSRIEQQEVALRRANLQVDQLLQSVRQEVRRALRDLEAARERIRAQETTLKTARTNYRFAQQRLKEGVSSPLQVREASRQLDQSRLNYLRSVRDYLQAKSAFETALGMPAGTDDNLFQTAKR